MRQSHAFLTQNNFNVNFKSHQRKAAIQMENEYLKMRKTTVKFMETFLQKRQRNQDNIMIAAGLRKGTKGGGGGALPRRDLMKYKMMGAFEVY